MAERKDLSIGDSVNHRFRTYYQKCVIIEIEEGCNGLIKVVCEDGFYGGVETTEFCPHDLAKL
jgi:hypothetical protein